MMDKPTDTAVPERMAVGFAQLGPEAAEALATGFGAAAGAALGERLAAGRKAYAIWKDGAVAVVGWASFTPENIGELGLWARVRPGEAYVWDCVTQPTFRRQGLYRALLAGMAESLFADGCRRIWIGADLSNTPSQHGIAGAGFRPIVDLLIAPVGRRQLFWLEGLPGATEAEVAAAQYALFGGWARAPMRDSRQ